MRAEYIGGRIVGRTHASGPMSKLLWDDGKQGRISSINLGKVKRANGMHRVDVATLYSKQKGPGKEQS